MMAPLLLFLTLIAQPPGYPQQQTDQGVDVFRADGATKGGWASPPLTCLPRCCRGEAYSVYRFPPGSRRPTDPPGTEYPNGWKVRAELGRPVGATFSPGFRGTVRRVVFCRPWGEPLPTPVCAAERVVETADIFSDGFESGDVSAWSGGAA